MLSLSRRSFFLISGSGACKVLFLQSASFVDARIRWVRDRGLDHAVEKEKNLRPLLSLKNLIYAEPSKSLPVSVAAEHKTRIDLPFRAIEFIRRYPSVFVEYPDPDDHRRPHIRLTPEALELHQQECAVYENTRPETADRLVKLLMLSPESKLPLCIIDHLKWDLGLPDDYPRSLLPVFPDYFDITGNSNELFLDLVCWSGHLAASVMEQRAANSNEGYHKGMSLAFPLQFSRGFELEKKVKKWVDEWQRLPYMSPYERGSNLNPKSDIGEKWMVGVLHELLHLFIGKKAEKDILLMLGQCLGLRPGFKKAFLQYPGIFYLCNKLRTHTVVLREAYRRDFLIEKHPLVDIRFRYIHLMGQSKVASKTTPSRWSSIVRTGKRGGHEMVDGEEYPCESIDDSELHGEEGEDDDDDGGGDNDDDDEEEEEEEEEDKHHAATKHSPPGRPSRSRTRWKEQRKSRFPSPQGISNH